MASDRNSEDRWLPRGADILRILIIVSLATALGFLVDRLIASEAAVISVYMLAVLLVSLGAAQKLTGPIASVLCLLVYDFCFIQPRFIFVTYGREYSFIFMLMCIVSVLAGTLTQRLKINVRQASDAAFRSRLLFETNQLMQRASSREEIRSALAEQLKKLLGRTVIIYPAALGAGEDIASSTVDRTGRQPMLEDPRIFPISEESVSDKGASQGRKEMRHFGHSGTTDLQAEAPPYIRRPVYLPPHKRGGKGIRSGCHTRHGPELRPG